MRKPRSCSGIPEFLPNHGVIRQFLPWTCSQVLCDHAYKIWWGLDLIWPFDHRVIQEPQAENFVSGLGLKNCKHRLNRWLSVSLTGDQGFAHIRVLGFQAYCTGVVYEHCVTSSSVHPALSFLRSPVHWALSFSSSDQPVLTEFVSVPLWTTAPMSFSILSDHPVY